MENNNRLEDRAKCFQTLYPEELKFISDKKKQLDYLKGEQIFKQGAFSPYVIYIIDGLVKISLQTGIEKQINIRLAHSGEFLAFSSIFGDDTYAYTATALRNSSICMIDKEALKNLLLENAEFSMRISSKNCKNEARFYEIIKNISYKQMPGKLASAIIYLSSPEFEGENVFTLLTRQDLAEFASVSTESTIKLLKEFEQEKIIELKAKDIIIKNHQRLLNISRTS
ncbi:MAG: Crp/Fnr family transcriptional regulator [Bacteroidales bacterium]|nr:Crp/Fnr family transcriptional regulator [Bacteroidales bacterium]